MKLNGHQWLMSNIVAEQEAEAAAERERVAELRARLKAIREFVPRRTASAVVAKAPAPKPKPTFRVTNELLDRHDATERKARLAEFREAAGFRNFSGLINTINTTNF